MTDRRIEQIRERLEAATPGPGPWVGEVKSGAQDDVVRPTFTASDVELIANAPADIAYLLERVEGSAMGWNAIRRWAAENVGWTSDSEDGPHEAIAQALIAERERAERLRAFVSIYARMGFEAAEALAADDAARGEG